MYLCICMLAMCKYVRRGVCMHIFCMHASKSVFVWLYVCKCVSIQCTYKLKQACVCNRDQLLCKQ